MYSKPILVAVDVVMPQHQGIHADLERWGYWQRERYTQATCASAEKGHDKGGRDATPPATAPMPADPRLMAIDQAWRLMVRRVPQHAECLRLFYIGTPRAGFYEREEPQLICRRLVVHKRDFGRFMGHCRSMMLNILRELDV